MPLLLPPSRSALHPAAGLIALLFAASGVHAQYKVVAPDGSVTYTDRPPASANARITPIGRTAIAAAAATNPELALPTELRNAVQRHPVTLLTSDGCTPCDSGRRLLQQRGVPFAERRVVTDEDGAALERMVGARSVPSLMIGAQPLRGFNETDWMSYLDAAGYPRQNRLPRTWQAQPPRPLVERATPQAAAPAPSPEPAEPDPAPESPTPRVRF